MTEEEKKFERENLEYMLQITYNMILESQVEPDPELDKIWAENLLELYESPTGSVIKGNWVMNNSEDKPAIVRESDKWRDGEKNDI
jgi:hypothetical protein